MLNGARSGVAELVGGFYFYREGWPICSIYADDSIASVKPGHFSASTREVASSRILSGKLMPLGPEPHLSGSVLGIVLGGSNDGPQASAVHFSTLDSCI